FAPSSEVLAEMQARGFGAKRTPRYMIVGDPAYSSEKSGDKPKLALIRTGESLDVQRLEGTHEEVFGIACLLSLRDTRTTDAQRAALLRIPSRRSASIAADAYELHIGDEARRDIFSRDLREFTNIHIAAHGHVDPDDPRRSGLVLAYEPGSEGLLPLEDVLK